MKLISCACCLRLGKTSHQRLDTSQRKQLPTMPTFMLQSGEIKNPSFRLYIDYWLKPMLLARPFLFSLIPSALPSISFTCLCGGQPDKLEFSTYHSKLTNRRIVLSWMLFVFLANWTVFCGFSLRGFTDVRSILILGAEPARESLPFQYRYSLPLVTATNILEALTTVSKTQNWRIQTH